jgi:hypothetical protein
MRLAAGMVENAVIGEIQPGCWGLQRVPANPQAIHQEDNRRPQDHPQRSTSGAAFR